LILSSLENLITLILCEDSTFVACTKEIAIMLFL